MDNTYLLGLIKINRLFLHCFVERTAPVFEVTETIYLFVIFIYLFVRRGIH